jgi:uncharacterized protein (DUF2126 family)
MGKHYPGEQLPRWALYSHWRKDGEAVWRNPELLASDDDTDSATPDDAARFARILAERLQVDPDLVNPAYEDIHYYLWKEHRLPANVVVEDAKLRDPLERERLTKVFAQGLNTPVGSVLPLRWETVGVPRIDELSVTEILPKLTVVAVENVRVFGAARVRLPNTADPDTPRFSTLFPVDNVTSVVGMFTGFRTEPP